ncbi:hypothetical protein [Kordia sp.]|uniref:hypothetical protein n=1 Tax=Kordia sp. TaxID=1965332 RepID=UPI003D6B6D0A
MGFFNLFKKKLKLTDDLFGELTYMTSKDASLNVYEGNVRFQGSYIGIGVDADENGPTKEQKEFFKKLDATYNHIKENIIIPFLKKELEDALEHTGLEDFDNQFEFDGISIERIKDENVKWSITYYSNPMRHYVTVDFVNMEPTLTGIDG